MVTIEVYIDEFGTEDIIDEFISRLGEMTDYQKKRVMAAIRKNPLEDKSISGTTLEDIMKKEYMDKVFEKYTLSYIESVLPV